MQKLFDPHTYGELNVTMPTFQWKWLIYWALPTSPDLNDLSSLGPWFDPFFATCRTLSSDVFFVVVC